MLRNPKSLVLRTDITNRSEDKEHNPRSPSARSPSVAPVLPPISLLPSIEVTSPAGQTTAPPPSIVVNSPTSPTGDSYHTPTASWKEKEAEFERSFSFPARDLPNHPPPAYASMASPTTDGPAITTRQRRLNLPKLNPHARVSSINPAKSPIDNRKWHEKRRNMAYISGFSLTTLIVVLLLNYLYVIPMLRSNNETQSDIQNPRMLTGGWDMAALKLETVAAEDSTVVDQCASKEDEFERCVDSKWLEIGAGSKYSFDLTENDDGTFQGVFGEGIFESTGQTEVLLTPSRYGLMSKWVYTDGDVSGKLSSDGCVYTRAVLFLVTFDNGLPTYKITEKMMVAPEGNCVLPQGRRDDFCICNFIGTRPKSLKKRR